MTTEFLLPCPCGQKIRVSPAQAGQTIHCSCGRSVEVPTLMAMRALEPADSGEPSPARGGVWGTRQRLILIGLVVMLVSGGTAFYFSRGKPRSTAHLLETDGLQRRTERMSLIETYQEWHELKQGLDRKRFIDKEYDKRLGIYRQKMGAALAFFALGVAMLVAGLCVPRARGPNGVNHE